MKTLYFDVDGTVLLADQDEPKPCLASGRLEAAVRRAGFLKLVCVGNFCRIAGMIKEIGVEYDELGVLLGICRGVFTDAQWFRSVASLVRDPQHRTEHIDFSSDWWYLDDLAAQYLLEANQEHVLTIHQGRRVFMPSPIGDGQDILDWLKETSGPTKD